MARQLRILVQNDAADLVSAPQEKNLLDGGHPSAVSVVEA